RRGNSMYCSRPAKPLSGSFSVKLFGSAPAVGHHSGGCESGVKTKISRLGLVACASSRRVRRNGAKNRLPRAVPSTARRDLRLCFGRSMVVDSPEDQGVAGEGSKRVRCSGLGGGRRAATRSPNGP